MFVQNAHARIRYTSRREDDWDVHSRDITYRLSTRMSRSVSLSVLQAVAQLTTSLLEAPDRITTSSHLSVTLILCIGSAPPSLAAHTPDIMSLSADTVVSFCT